MNRKRWVVGISGASGTPIAVELLKALNKQKEVEVHLVVTDGGEKTLLQECELMVADLHQWVDTVYDEADIGAPPASGSWNNSGMIVVPCGMKTVAGIVSGYSDNLLLRAADVTLKERRKLILVTRECPLSTIHLRNMLDLSQLGVTILPPVLSYYNHPQTIQDATRHIVGKIMDCMGIDYDQFKRWGE